MLRLPVRLTPAGPRTTRLVAVALGLELIAGLGAVTLLDRPEAPAVREVTPRARIAPDVSTAEADRLQERVERERAVRELLAERAGALVRRDKDSFLAVVDPAAVVLRARQAALFDALEQVPLQTWRYRVDVTTERPADAVLDRKYGRDRWWAPDVALEYALAGYDDRPTVAEHHLTFVKRDGRWLLGADDDFEDVGLATPRALWDRGPVVSERVGDVLVLGRPTARRLLRNVASLTAAAVPRVDRVWGADWRRGAVVVVPTSAEEMSELLGNDSDLSQIAAVATAELGGGASEFDPSGDRILVNPDTFGRLGQLGRRVVLTHELTHVATRRSTGPAVPAWLAEGFADYVGYQDVDLPLALSARELRKDVRAGRPPAALPVDADFHGGNARLAQAYEQSWLAVRLLADQHGQEALLRFYRAVGARRGGVPATAAVDQALRAELGTSTSALTRAWRSSLQRDLG
ncbi:MAG: hypothetical protein JWM62_1183 [Frankiales bacterium]|nr:hypothetical protein [Frankiales bacterium]